MSADAIADVKLAVTEAATNAVMHAYADTAGELAVTATARDGELAIVIGDTGPGLVERDDSPGLGVGLSVIATVAWRLRIVSAPGGTAGPYGVPLSALRLARRIPSARGVRVIVAGEVLGVERPSARGSTTLSAAAPAVWSQLGPAPSWSAQRWRTSSNSAPPTVVGSYPRGVTWNGLRRHVGRVGPAGDVPELLSAAIVFAAACLERQPASER